MSGEVVTDVAEPIKDPARGQHPSLFNGAGTDCDGLLELVSQEQSAAEFDLVEHIAAGILRIPAK